MRHTAGMTRSQPPRKARYRKIETAPEKMHRTRLAEKTCAEMAHHLMRGHQHPEEAARVFGVIRLVDVVLVERNGARNFAGHRIDRDEESQLTQRDPHLGIERRNRQRPHRYFTEIAVTQAKPHDVLDEIEFDFQATVLAGHR